MIRSQHRTGFFVHRVEVHFLEKARSARDVAYLHSVEALTVLFGEEVGEDSVNSRVRGLFGAVDQRLDRLPFVHSLIVVMVVSVVEVPSKGGWE